MSSCNVGVVVQGAWIFFFFVISCINYIVGRAVGQDFGYQLLFLRSSGSYNHVIEDRTGLTSFILFTLVSTNIYDLSLFTPLNVQFPIFALNLPAASHFGASFHILISSPFMTFLGMFIFISSFIIHLLLCS